QRRRRRAARRVRAGDPCAELEPVRAEQGGARSSRGAVPLAVAGDEAVRTAGPAEPRRRTARPCRPRPDGRLVRLLLRGGRLGREGGGADRVRRPGRPRGPAAGRVGAARRRLGPPRKRPAAAAERAAACPFPGARPGGTGLKIARILALLAAVALVTGCGSGSPSAESVVRAWSAALNGDDNNTAASLFAQGAKVVQNGHVLTLR